MSAKRGMTKVSKTEIDIEKKLIYETTKDWILKFDCLYGNAPQLVCHKTIQGVSQCNLNIISFPYAFSSGVLQNFENNTSFTTSEKVRLQSIAVGQSFELCTHNTDGESEKHYAKLVNK